MKTWQRITTATFGVAALTAFAVAAASAAYWKGPDLPKRNHSYSIQTDQQFSRGKHVYNPGDGHIYVAADGKIHSISVDWRCGSSLRRRGVEFSPRTLGANFSAIPVGRSGAAKGKFHVTWTAQWFYEDGSGNQGPVTVSFSGQFKVARVAHQRGVAGSFTVSTAQCKAKNVTYIGY
jgi:hypothetical protein